MKFKRIIVALIIALIITLYNVIVVFATGDAASKENATISGSADIVFIIDSTGSMEKYITSVKENLTNFVNSLSKKSVTLKMSVIEYRDIEVDGASSTVCYRFGDSNWTNKVDEVIKVFDSISVAGGGDDPETPIDAFEKIDYIEDSAKKFVFLLSDANYKNYDDTEENNRNNHFSMSYWTELFRDNNIKVTVVSQTKYESDYNYLYSLTGGRFIDISSKDYFKLMQEYSEWIYENSLDSDGDGIPDEWEINGVDTDHDGVIDLDLAKIGADPSVPDIFIEADWMEYEGDDFNFLWIHEKVNKKNTSPSSKALELVYEKFKSHGINVHIDAGPESIMNYDTGEKWGTNSGGNALPFESVFYTGDNYENWNKTAMSNFTNERWTTFKYLLFVNQYDAGNGQRSSGIAENLPGQFFIVASNCIGGGDHDVALAGTIMHELGHTLGLSHGGLCNDPDTTEVAFNHENYKPNHISIMNYTYQFSGLRTTSGTYIADYQDFSLPEIDENHINETRGIDPYGATEGKGLTIKVPIKNKFLLWDIDGEEDSEISRKAIDFNKNGVMETDIRRNLNEGYNSDIGLLTATLNEWKNLNFKGGLIGGYGEEINLEEISLLVEKSNSKHELDEISIDEAFENGLFGEPGDCQFDLVDSKTLYSEIDKQNLILDIKNLYPEDTQVKIIVNSDAFSSEYSENYHIPKDGTKVSIEVQDKLAVGTYNINYKMILESGKEIVESGKINVIAPEKYSMKVGESKDIPVDEISNCRSSDDSIIKVSDNTISAKKKGVAFLTVTSNNNVFIAKIVVTSTNDSIVGIIIAIIAGIAILITAGIIVVFYFKKNNVNIDEEDIGDALLSGEATPDNLVNVPSNEIINEESNLGGLEILSGSMKGLYVPIKDKEILYLGKDPKHANVVFSNDYENVSRLHCSVSFDEKTSKYYVVDSSSNGTFFVNNRRLLKGHRTVVEPNTVLILANEGCMIRLK